MSFRSLVLTICSCFTVAMGGMQKPVATPQKCGTDLEKDVRLFRLDLDTGRKHPALELTQVAYKRFDTNPGFGLTLGKPLLSYGLTGQARDLKACASQDPAAQLIRQAQDPQGSAESRLAAYHKAVELCPNDQALYIGFTTLLVRAQRTQDALIWAQRGLARWPGNTDLSRSLGVAWLAEGHPQKALQVLKQLPPDPQTDFELGMAYRALGNHADARKELASAYTAGRKDPYVLYALIEEDHALGDREAGLKDFTTLERDFPDSAWLHLLLGRACADRHDLPGATREYRAAVAAGPSIPVAHFLLGRLAFDRGAYSEAESDFREEIRLDPTFADPHLYLGETLIRQTKNAEAIEQLKQAIALNPKSSLAYQALATAEDAAGQPDAALATLRKGQQRFPNDAAFPAQLARRLLRQGRAAEADQQGALAEQISRRNNPLHYTGEPPPRDITATPNSGSERAKVASEPPLDEAKINLALSPLRRCVERKDAGCATAELAKIHEAEVLNSAPYLKLKAETLLFEHRMTEALASASAAAEKNPEDPTAWLTLGHLQQKAGDQSSAIRSFLEAQRLEPRSAATVYSLGMSFFLLGQDTNADDYYQRAAHHFRFALELDPKLDRAVFMLGVIEVVEFKLSEARSYVEKALALSPQNPYYHLHFGILLARMGETEKALGEMKTAEKLDPGNALCHLSLGETYARQHDFEAARKELEKAVQLNPRLASAYYTLGSVYQRLGLKTEAETAYATFQTEKKRESMGEVDRVSGAIQGTRADAPAAH
jgi:tetratricopeptide (TPR) repeat protein